MVPVATPIWKTTQAMSTRVVVEGDRVSEKRDLVKSYVKANTLGHKNIGIIDDNIDVTVLIEGVPYRMFLLDATSEEHHDRVRSMSYRLADVILVCFSIINPKSFENVQNKWIPDIKYDRPGVPFIIVGTQSENRTDPEDAEAWRHLVSVEDGKELARDTGAVEYMECSALTQEGLDDVFQKAILAALNKDDFRDGKGNQLTIQTKDRHDDDIMKTFNEGMKDGHINLTIKKLVLLGPPCVGKTAFKALLFNWPAPRYHHSTPIASRPIRAVERIADRNEGKVWVIMEPQQIFHIVTDAIKSLNELNDCDESVSLIKLSESKVVGSIDNHILSTKESSSSKPIIPAEAKGHSIVQEPKINYADELVKQLEIKKNVKKSKLLHKSTWVNVLDSGGQPQFADISRAFLRGNAINVIVFRLTEKLSDKPRFAYSLNGKVITAPSELQMTNLQLIQHLVRSISSSKSTTIRVAGHELVTKPFFILVGTYYDEITSGIFSKREIITEETIADKNQKILSVLREFRDHLIFFNKESDEVIFPVDNLCWWNRKKISAQIRERIMSQEGVGFNIPVPIRWFMFELQIQDATSSSEHGIIPLSTCYDIGSKLKMKERDVLACLAYFDSLTLYFYYNKVLPDVVFTNPQYLLEMLSNIVRVSFVSIPEEVLPKGQSLSPVTQRLLREDGVFDESLLDTLALPFVPPFFTKTDFLRLLQHISVIAPINSPFPERRFFTPVVLSTDTLTKEQKQVLSTSIEPLIITFNNKVVLQGIFPTLVVTLLNREEKPHFFIDSRSDNFPRQLRHAIKLYSEDLFGSLFLCDEYSCIEIYFTGLSKHCYDLRQVIIQALMISATTLAYDVESLKITALVACNRLCHISAINNEKRHQISLSYEIDDCPVIGCSVEDIPVGELTDERQKCWHIKPVNTSSATPISNVLPDGVLNMEHIPIVLSAIREVNVWEVLGMYLGLKFAIIEEIRINNHHQIEPSRKDMICKWFQKGNATRQHLASALVTMREIRTAHSIFKDKDSFEIVSVIDNTLPEGILNEEYTSLILSQVQELSDWEELGIYLGLNFKFIEQIKKDNFYQVETSRMTMIVKWLQSGKATRDGLISALKTMNKNSIAHKIQQLPTQ